MLMIFFLFIRKRIDESHLVILNTGKVGQGRRNPNATRLVQRLMLKRRTKNQLSRRRLITKTLHWTRNVLRLCQTKSLCSSHGGKNCRNSSQRGKFWKMKNGRSQSQFLEPGEWSNIPIQHLETRKLLVLFTIIRNCQCQPQTCPHFFPTAVSR